MTHSAMALRDRPEDQSASDSRNYREPTVRRFARRSQAIINNWRFMKSPESQVVVASLIATRAITKEHIMNRAAKIFD